MQHPWMIGHLVALIIFTALFSAASAHPHTTENVINFLFAGMIPAQPASSCPPTPSQESIKVAAIVNSVSSPDLQLAYETARSTIVGDRNPTIDLVLRDTHGDSRNALRHVKELYVQGVRLFTGFGGSNEVKLVMDWANVHARDALFFSLTSTAPSLDYDNLFRMSMNDFYQAHVVASVIERVQRTAVVILRDDSLYANDFNESLHIALPLKGIEISDEIVFADGSIRNTATAQPFIARLQTVLGQHNDNVPGVLCICSPNEVAHLLRAASTATHESVLTTPWFGTDNIAFSLTPFSDPVVLSAARKVGLFSTLYIGDRLQADNDARLSFYIGMSLLKGAPVTAPTYGLAFDSLLLLHSTCKLQLRDWPQNVQAYIRHTAKYIYGISGVLEFEQTGDRKRGSFLIGFIPDPSKGTALPDGTIWSIYGSTFLNGLEESSEWTRRVARNKIRRGTSSEAPQVDVGAPLGRTSEEAGVGHYFHQQLWALLQSKVSGFLIEYWTLDPTTMNVVHGTFAEGFTGNATFPSVWPSLVIITGTDVNTGQPLEIIFLCSPSSRTSDSSGCYLIPPELLEQRSLSSSTLSERLSDREVQVVAVCGPWAMGCAYGPGPGCVSGSLGCVENVLRALGIVPEWIPPLPPVRVPIPIGGSCVVAGTPVAMADGTNKPIETVRPGDKIVSAVWSARDGTWKASTASVAYLDVTVLGERTLLGFNGLAPFITDDHPLPHPHSTSTVLSFNPINTAHHFPDLINDLRAVQHNTELMFLSESELRLQPIVKVSREESLPSDTPVYTIFTDKLEHNAFIANGLLMYADAPFLLREPAYALVLQDVLDIAAAKLHYDSGQSVVDIRKEMHQLAKRITTAMHEFAEHLMQDNYPTATDEFHEFYQSRVQSAWSKFDPRKLNRYTASLFTACWRESQSFKFLQAMPPEKGLQLIAALAKAANTVM
ncbi:hypothetical protein QOT17_017839 [Balamuthia mandrillaris]